MPDLGNILLNLVLILVAGAVGALLTGLVVYYLVYWSTRRQPPYVVVQFFRTIGGLAAMVLAYLVLSTEGGGGFGFGPGGFGFSGQDVAGTGKGTGQGTGATASKEKPPAETKSSTPASTEKKVEAGRMLKVEMLGGKRYQPDSNRFYLVEGEREPKTLAELTALLQQRQQESGLPGIEVIIYRTGSVASSHAAVKDLQERASQLGLAVKLVIHDQDAPPLP